MKQIQIPEQLFMELVKFHLLDMEENLPSIKQGLEAKMERRWTFPISRIQM